MHEWIFYGKTVVFSRIFERTTARPVRTVVPRADSRPSAAWRSAEWRNVARNNSSARRPGRRSAHAVHLHKNI